MDMPGRQYSAGNGYRYGFNGKEKDTEEPVQYDYGFRIYDPRLVRFKSVDPLAKSFPWNSPYSYAEGDVLRSIDLDGTEKYVVTYWYDNKGNHRKTTIKAIRAQDSKEIMEMNFSTANGGDLTDKDKDVWVRKLYLDGRRKEAATGKAVLNASEKALFGRAITKRTDKYIVEYDLGDEQGGDIYKSEEFANNKFEYREASQNIPLIHNLKPSFNNATFFYADPSSGKGTLIPKDAAIGIDKKIKKFYDLPSKIKDDGGIKSVNITMTWYVNDQLSDKDFANLKNAYTQVANQIKKIYSKSGVKNINVNPVIKRRKDFQQANANTPDIQITLKR
ncbi:MAG: RHS repeat-associated core domain-containing protein [Chitinophagaceae bacterium]